MSALTLTYSLHTKEYAHATNKTILSTLRFQLQMCFSVMIKLLAYAESNGSTTMNTTWNGLQSP